MFRTRIGAYRRLISVEELHTNMQPIFKELTAGIRDSVLRDSKGLKFAVRFGEPKKFVWVSPVDPC